MGIHNHDQGFLRRHLVSMAIGLGAIASSADGQSRLFSRFGSSAMDYYGYSVRSAGDANGDGFDDILVGAVGEHSNVAGNGLIQTLSGRDGSVLHSIYGIDAFDQVGLYMGGGGDVNGDGFDDFVYAAHVHLRAEISLVSGQDGSVLYTLVPPQHAGSTIFFGLQTALGGDVDGDGLADVLVSGLGLVELYSGVDGSLIQSMPPPGPNVNSFGRSAAFIGDVDADGREDFAVSGSHPSGALFASVFVFSGVDRSILYRVDAPMMNDGFASSIARAGDVNGDSTPDFMVLAAQDVMGRSGYARVFSGVDGALLIHIQGNAVGDELRAIAGVGDVNADGFDDIALGAPAALQDEVRVISGKDGLPLATFSPTTPQQFGFGFSLSGVGDANGDGHADFAIGCPFAVSPSGVFDVGAVEVINGACLAIRRYCSGGLNTVGKRARMLTDGTTSLSEPDFSVSAIDLPPGRVGLFQFGDTQLQTPFGEGFRCIGGNTFRVRPFVHANAAGVAGTGIDLTTSPFSPGATWNFQLWYRDSGPSGFNLSDAVEVTFCQ